MPEEKAKAAAGVPEPAEQTESKASADNSLDGLLARIPSLTSYFGSDESAEKPETKEETSSEEPPPEEPVAEPEPL